ncbi:MAG: elongation factor P [Deltaproteobacteria bacterium]|nr:elongation factor P [Deltaproteobacteria bacterium]
MIDSSDMKRGVLIDLDGAPWLVIDCTFQSPSARGGAQYTKVRIRNLRTGQVLSRSYRGGEMLPTADCEKRSVQFLYRDGDDFMFMDEESYDQFSLGSDVMGEAAGYLVEGAIVRSFVYNEAVISVELPNTVDLEVTDTAPALKGATAHAQLKPAVLETGIQVNVPPYITPGEKVRVDTRTGRFVSRANE